MKEKEKTMETTTAKPRFDALELALEVVAVLADGPLEAIRRKDKNLAVGTPLPWAGSCPKPTSPRRASLSISASRQSQVEPITSNAGSRLRSMG